MINNSKYTNVAIALHWLIGIAILFMFILGWFMTELPRETPKTTSFDIFHLGLFTWEVAEEQSQRTFYFSLVIRTRGVSYIGVKKNRGDT